MAKANEESVNEFKKFVRERPELMKEVKKQGKSWKDVFDEWVLFGEDHEIWEEEYGIEDVPKKKPKGATELMRIFDFIGNLDTDSVQERLDQLNGALTNIQDLIVQFQPDSNQQQNNQSQFPPPYGMPGPGFFGGPPNGANNNQGQNSQPNYFQGD